LVAVEVAQVAAVEPPAWEVARAVLDPPPRSAKESMFAAA